jgi:hypothetical protein
MLNHATLQTVIICLPFFHVQFPKRIAFFTTILNLYTVRADNYLTFPSSHVQFNSPKRISFPTTILNPKAVRTYPIDPSLNQCTISSKRIKAKNRQVLAYFNCSFFGQSQNICRFFVFPFPNLF